MNNFYSRFGDICEDQRTHIRLMRPTRHAIKRDLVQAQREIIRREREAEAEAKRQRLIEEEKAKKKAKKDLAKAYLKGLIQKKVLSLSDKPTYCDKYVKDFSRDLDELGTVTMLFTVDKYRIVRRRGETVDYPDTSTFCFTVHRQGHTEITYHYYSSRQIDEFIDHAMDFRENYAFDKYDSKFRLKSNPPDDAERAFDDIFLQCVGDCCVCYEPTKNKTMCCKQHYCFVCESKAGHRCPLCRKYAPFSHDHIHEDDDEDDE